MSKSSKRPPDAASPDPREIDAQEQESVGAGPHAADAQPDETEYAPQSFGPGAEPPVAVPQAGKPTPAQAMAAAAAESPALLSPSAQSSGARGPERPFPVREASPAMPAAVPIAPVVRRRGLVPRWLPWAAGGAVLAVLVIIVIGWLVVRGDVVRVPSVQGLTSKAAQTRLQEAGLKMSVADQLFSATVPAGSIVSQQPAPGATLNSGSFVRVAVSAGSETFQMPDVVGAQLSAAQARLAAKGLSVVVETAPSEQDQGTVIATDPSAGTDVQTGSSVRLTVAAGTNATQTLLPTKLNGRTFVIDPAPMPIGSSTDTVMDVARRLRALLEASGAHVVLTRDVTDQGTAANTLARAQRAKAAASDALIGLEVTPSGTGGLEVFGMPPTAGAQLAKSQVLAQAFVTALKTDFPSVTSQATIAGGDTILTDTGVPGVRLDLGSTSSSADTLSFTDPQWADNVSQDAYRAVAQVFGVQ